MHTVHPTTVNTLDLTTAQWSWMKQSPDLINEHQSPHLTLHTIDPSCCSTKPTENTRFTSLHKNSKVYLTNAVYFLNCWHTEKCNCQILSAGETNRMAISQVHTWVQSCKRPPSQEHTTHQICDTKHKSTLIFTDSTWARVCLINVLLLWKWHLSVNLESMTMSQQTKQLSEWETTVEKNRSTWRILETWRPMWFSLSPLYSTNLPCYDFCICLLTNKHQKCKSVELGD